MSQTVDGENLQTWKRASQASNYSLLGGGLSLLASDDQSDPLGVGSVTDETGEAVTKNGGLSGPGAASNQQAASLVREHVRLVGVGLKRHARMLTPTSDRP